MANKYEFVIVGKDGTVQAFRSVENNVSKLSTTAKRAGGILAAAFSVRAVVEYADSFTLLQNKLKTVTDSQEELTTVTARMLELAKDTRSEVSSIVDLYAKMTRNTENLNISQDQLFVITELVNKAFQIQGATQAEAAGATLQFGQALASGVLRGQEFNSVSEQGTEILRAIGAELGKDMGQLRAMAKEGKLTADVVTSSLLRQASSIRETYAETDSTISQAWTQVTDAALTAIGTIDDKIGASNSMATFLENIAVNLRIFSGAATEIEAATEAVSDLQEQVNSARERGQPRLAAGYAEDLRAARSELAKLIEDRKKADADALQTEVTTKANNDDEELKASNAKKLATLQASLKEQTAVIEKELQLQQSVIDGSLSSENAAIYASYFQKIDAAAESYQKQRALAGDNAEALLQIEEDYKNASLALNNQLNQALVQNDGANQARIQSRLDTLSKALTTETELVERELSLQSQVRTGKLSEEEAAIYSSYFARTDSITANYQAQVALAQGNSDELLRIQEEYSDAARAINEQLNEDLSSAEKGPTFIDVLSGSMEAFQNQASGTLAQVALGMEDGEDAAKTFAKTIITQLVGATINYGIQQAIAYATGAAAATAAEATKTTAVVTSLGVQTAAATTAQATVTGAAVASGAIIAVAMAPAAAASSVASFGAAPAAAAPIALSTIGAIIAAIVGGIGVIGSFEGGGYIPDGPRIGGQDGRGGRLAMVHPDESIIDHKKGQSASSGGNITIQQNPTFYGADSDMVFDALAKDRKKTARLIQSMQRLPA